jgi:uncharacterized metal-binding protein
VKVTLLALPVVYACEGCAELGNAARDAGARLERDGIAEMIWLGAPGARATTRYPVWALDGCGKRCARRWLVDRGVPVARSYVARGERISF